MGRVKGIAKSTAGVREKPSNDRLHPWNWRPVHTKILVMTRNGATVPDICKAVHLSTPVVSQVRSSKMFHEKLVKFNERAIEETIKLGAQQSVTLTQEARELLTKAAPQAAKKMIKLSQTGTKDDKVQFDAAKDILDRAGLRPIEVVHAMERVYTAAEISKAQGTLLETEAIIMRLRTKTSPFVLQKAAQSQATTNRLASSSTESSSETPTEVVEARS